MLNKKLNKKLKSKKRNKSLFLDVYYKKINVYKVTKLLLKSFPININKFNKLCKLECQMNYHNNYKIKKKKNKCLNITNY